MFKALRKFLRYIKKKFVQERRMSFDGFEYSESRGLPDSNLKDGKLLLTGSAQKPKWLSFKCPCGCGNVVSLNLMESHYPAWSVTFEKRGLTVSPSVDVTTCGSHFWIRNNQISWVS